MTAISDLNQLRYATDLGATEEPSEGKKDAGYGVREAPASKPWNWSRNKIFERFKSLQGGENHLIIGDTAQKSNFVADLLIAELLDAVTEAGDKIVFLNGTHTLAGAKNLSDNDLELRCQSSSSEIDLDGNVLTLSGNRLRGELNITNSAPNSVIISGSDVEAIRVRIDDPAAVNFSGSGSIVVNGKLINNQSVLIELSNQPDHVVLTAAQQALYANDDSIVRYDQSAQNFKRRDNTVVPVADGSWVMINSLEELTIDDLVFEANNLKIECYRNFKLDLGDQGDNIPYAVFIKGNDCQVNFQMFQSIKDLADLLGDDRLIFMANGLSAMENRRVIKNQGEHNRIIYNNEEIFSGGNPSARIDFAKPNHPYLLEWDGFIYDGLLRDLPSLPFFDNKKKCWFAELHYWLDRRFNAQLLNPDTTLAYHSVRMPPRSEDFFRPINNTDPDRHSRTDAGIFVDTILAADYSQVSDKIILDGANPEIDVKNVKNGQRIQASGLPGGGTATTVVRPGSIVTSPGNESFLIMNAQTNAPVTNSASGNLTLDFSGMAAGSHQDDQFQNIIGNLLSRNVATTGVPPHLIIESTIDPGVFSSFFLSSSDSPISAAGAAVNQHININFDSSNSPGARAGTETRARNSLIIPYYKL